MFHLIGESESEGKVLSAMRYLTVVCCELNEPERRELNSKHMKLRSNLVALVLDLGHDLLTLEPSLLDLSRRIHLSLLSWR